MKKTLIQLLFIVLFLPSLRAQQLFNQVYFLRTIKAQEFLNHHYVDEIYNGQVLCGTITGGSMGGQPLSQSKPYAMRTQRMADGSVILSWRKIPHALGYNVQYGPEYTSSSDWTDISVPSDSSSGSSWVSVLIDNPTLAFHTAYEWHVQTICRDGRVTAFGEIIYFVDEGINDITYSDSSLNNVVNSPIPTRQGFIFTPSCYTGGSFRQFLRSCLSLISIQKTQDDYDHNPNDTLFIYCPHPWTSVKIPYAGLSVGVQAVPLRFWLPTKGYTISGSNYNKLSSTGIFQNISSPLSLGVVACGTWGKSLFNSTSQPISLWSCSLGLALPITATTLSKELLNGNSIDASIISSVTTSPEILPSIVFILQKYGVGGDIVLGLNEMLGPYCSTWAYQNKPFFGLGLSTGFGGAH